MVRWAFLFLVIDLVHKHGRREELFLVLLRNGRFERALEVCRRERKGR